MSQRPMKPFAPVMRTLSEAEMAGMVVLEVKTVGVDGLNAELLLMLDAVYSTLSRPCRVAALLSTESLAGIKILSQLASTICRMP